MVSPGSGKSWFIIENMIRQFIGKGFSLFVYDFKYDALTRLVYNQYLKHRHLYPPASGMYSINFTDLSPSHRCNLLDPSTMKYTADAIGATGHCSSVSIGTGFINKGTSLCSHRSICLPRLSGGYGNARKTAFILSTMPSMSQAPIDKLFRILVTEPEVSALIKPLILAYESRRMEMLDEQVASARIPLSRLA